MEFAVPSPPRTAPGTSEALKRMTMMPPASPIAVGSGLKGSSHDGRPNGSPGSSGTALRPTVKSAARRWKRLHEQCMMEKLIEMRGQKKENDKVERENARKLARRIPAEILAREWLKESQADVDIRAYLVDKVLPTLILGCEKLLTEVNNKGLAEKEEVEPNFNPINYLAKYLMRNNPAYSNFSEASPYVRGLREVTEQLRKELFKIEDNRLARVKADVKRRQEERAKQERLKLEERLRRVNIFMRQFVDWTDDVDEPLELTLVQSALRSFTEVVASFPEDLRKAAGFSQPLEPTDETGMKVNVKEFSKYLEMFTSDMPTDIFDQFLNHLTRCADAYIASVKREERRIELTNLFNSCDHSGIGLLDRHRVLQLFEQFWDGAREAYKNKLQNPRRWPVVEVEEAEEGDSEEEFEGAVETQNGEQSKEEDVRSLESSTATTQADLAKPESEAVVSSANETNVEESTEDVQKSAESLEKAGSSATTTSAARSGSDEQGVEALSGSDQRSEAPEGGEETEAKPSHSGTGPGSVSFADGTIYEREKTGLSVTSCSQSQASAFDECSLNVSQFVQLTETFLNERPPKEVFELLTRFLKEQYVETEEEKLKRLLKARQEAISAKRKLMINSLFEKWDNDGSGYLDQEEVEAVMLKYKEGQEGEAIHRSREKLKQQSHYVDVRLSKREFRTLLEMIVEEMPGADSFDNFVEFLTNSVERSFAERIRGEARKKWLQQIVTAGETGGSSMEPVYRAVFQALYKDAESHGGGKRISANIAMLEKNTSQPARGDVALRYVACTPEDAEFVLGKILFKDMPGVSFASVETGKPIHVPRVSNHGNIQFWDAERKVKEGSFIVVPLKDRRKRVFGLMGIDTLNDPHSKAIFITHEIQFFQGVAKAFSIAYHHVDIRKKLLRITESAISWIYRRSPHMNEITMYLVEPDGKEMDYVLRKMMTTDQKGAPHTFEPPPKLERKDNLFRDYLFKCVDNSETVSADAYGERHLAIPLRNELGRAVAIVDIGIGELKKLPTHENREVQRMLKLLQMAHREITKELAGEEKTMVLEVEKDEDTRVDVMFDRLMLMELRDNVSKLDSRSYSELRSYNEPPRVVQDILKAVLSIFYLQQAEDGEFDDWTNVKSYINGDLSQRISEYDPTASEVLIPAEKVMDLLKDVPHGAVTKHGSVPAQQMYNWVFVCLSLIEHTRKMRENSQGNILDNNDNTEGADTEGNEEPAAEEGAQEEGGSQQAV